MSYEFRRRGKNWHTAMGLLFIVSGTIVLVRQILIWTPDFVFDFILNSEFTNEKVSIAMLGFGVILIAIGMRDTNEQR
ncbi:MAG: putative membrane protein [Cenarchaeum symbiont of Oopsacas minuta]|nr:putative membrane protein [Cenarchaeum symbiont of Oopsacas minuta]